MDFLKTDKLEIRLAIVAKVNEKDKSTGLLLKDKFYNKETKAEEDREEWVNAYDNERFKLAESCAKIPVGTPVLVSIYRSENGGVYVNTIRRAGELVVKEERDGEEQENSILMGTACNVSLRDVNTKKGATKVAQCSIPVHKGYGDEQETIWHRVSFWNSDKRPDFAEKMATLLANKPKVAIYCSGGKEDSYMDANGEERTNISHFGWRVELVPKAEGSDFKKSEETEKPAAKSKKKEEKTDDDDFLITLSPKYENAPEKFSKLVAAGRDTWFKLAVQKFGDKATDDPVEGTISTKEQVERIKAYLDSKGIAY